MSPFIISIIVGIFVSMYVVWMLFRIEAYEETRVIDIIIVTVISCVVGGRGLWIAQHWSEINHTFGTFVNLSVHEFSLYGAVILPFIVVSLFIWRIDWPYWVSMDHVAVGGMFMTLFTTIGLAYNNTSVPVFPILFTNHEVYISAWWIFALYSIFIFLWFSIIRKVAYPGYVLGLFLIGTLRILLLLTALCAWLIIRYSYLWQKKRLKNN